MLTAQNLIGEKNREREKNAGVHKNIVFAHVVGHTKELKLIPEEMIIFKIIKLTYLLPSWVSMTVFASKVTD